MTYLIEEEEGRTIFINKSQLGPINEAVATLDSIYQKYYSKIDREVFNQIIQADPTFNPQKPDKMGKYGKWLLSLYTNNRLKLEDLYKAKEYLGTFSKYFNRMEVKDINQFKNLPSLYNAVKDFMSGEEATSRQDQIRRTKQNEAEIVFNSPEWEIIIPKTWEASKLYGKNTQWCTASKDNDSYFNAYSKQGPLYINIDKVNNTKYQFHFPTQQFMDATDSSIADEFYDGDESIAAKIGMPEDALKALASREKDTYILTFPPEDAVWIDSVVNYATDVEYTYRMIPNDEMTGYALYVDYDRVTDFKYRYAEKRDVRIEAGEYAILRNNETDLYDLYLDYGYNDLRLHIGNILTVENLGELADMPYLNDNIAILTVNGDFQIIDTKNAEVVVVDDDVEKFSTYDSESFLFVQKTNGWFDVVSLTDMELILENVKPYDGLSFEKEMDENNPNCMEYIMVVSAQGNTFKLDTYEGTVIGDDEEGY